jgi:azurin
MVMKPQSRLDVKPEDLEVILHGGIIVTGKLRDLILLRQTLQQDSRYRVVYTKNGNIPLYIVTRDEYLLIQKLRGENNGE